MNNIIEDNAFYSDDTILTMAIMDATLGNKNYNYYLRKYIDKYKEYKPNYNPYFNSSFSPNMIKWAQGNRNGNSSGNGAMMRISPIGYLFDDEFEVMRNAHLATIPSHNSASAIGNASLIALIIFYLRNGLSKDKITKLLKLDIKYKPFKKFNITCDDTIDNVFMCIFSFVRDLIIENIFCLSQVLFIKHTLLMGGDTDTNCAIVGSLAEALYGIDDELIEKANTKIPKDFVKKLKRYYK